LFVCIENSSRSQIAEGFARKLGLNASSAGTVPSTHVNPLVVNAMREVGVEISDSAPKELTAKMVEDVDLVVLTDASIGGSLPGGLRRKMRKKVVEWDLADPQGRSIEEIRFIRDQIERRVNALVKGSSDAGA